MKRFPFAQIPPQEALIYYAGGVYLLLKAGYDGFVRRNVESVAGDVLGIFLGVLFVWYGRRLWKAFRARSADRSKRDSVTGKRGKGR